MVEETETKYIVEETEMNKCGRNGNEIKQKLNRGRHRK